MTSFDFSLAVKRQTQDDIHYRHTSPNHKYERCGYSYAFDDTRKLKENIHKSMDISDSIIYPFAILQPQCYRSCDPYTQC